MHPAELDESRLLQQCAVRRIARGGPGGQHRNKTASAVILKHQPTGIIAEANERRDQSVNLRRAIFRLRVQLALEIRQPRPAAPSERWAARCTRGRVAIDGRHAEFPALLAEALDVLADNDYDPQPAAERLGCSPSQLVKLLAIEPRGLAVLNARRHERGLRPLRPRSSR